MSLRIVVTFRIPVAHFWEASTMSSTLPFVLAEELRGPRRVALIVLAALVVVAAIVVISQDNSDASSKSLRDANRQARLFNCLDRVVNAAVPADAPVYLKGDKGDLVYQRLREALYPGHRFTESSGPGVAVVSAYAADNGQCSGTRVDVMRP
jgi:hypothetical protein